MQIAGRRRIVSTAVVVVLAILLMVPPVSQVPYALAHVDPGVEGVFIDAINAERSAIGLGELSTAPDLTRVARQWSHVMAGEAGDERGLHHNPRLGSEVRAWSKVGENVGRGRGPDGLHAAFMVSPDHRANVLDRDWSEVGIGVAVVDGEVWVTQVFRQP